MKNSKWKTAFIGIGLFLCLGMLGLSFNINKVLADTISENELGDAIAHRYMDAVVQYAGTDDIDTLLNIQEHISNSDSVKDITKLLLKQVTSGVWKSQEFSEIDCREVLDFLSADTVNYMRTQLSGIQISEELADKLDIIAEECNDVINAYAAQVSYMIERSSAGIVVVEIYCVLTSVWFQLFLGLVLLLLGLWKWRISEGKGSALCLYGYVAGLEGIFYLLMVKLTAMRIVLSLTNRFLGRSMIVEARSLLNTGIAFLCVGVILWIAGKVWEKRKYISHF